MAQQDVCDATLRKRIPSFKGTIVIHFIVDASGRATEATVKRSEIDDPEFQGCILKVVDGLKFHAPAGGGEAIVSAGLSFAP